MIKGRVGEGESKSHYKIIDKVDRNCITLDTGVSFRRTRASKSAPGFADIVLFPSLAPEGPASAGSVVWEEITRIRRALGVLLRQLQQRGASISTSTRRLNGPQQTHLRVQQIVRHDALGTCRSLRHRSVSHGLILKQHRVLASKKLSHILRAPKWSGEVVLSRYSKSTIKPERN